LNYFSSNFLQAFSISSAWCFSKPSANSEEVRNGGTRDLEEGEREWKEEGGKSKYEKQQGQRGQAGVVQETRKVSKLQKTPRKINPHTETNPPTGEKFGEKKLSKKKTQNSKKLREKKLFKKKTQNSKKLREKNSETLHILADC
jgi:hypothetical protein